MTQPQSMVALEAVCYSIGGRTILRNISFSVQAQETLAILGASGSGKSTILRLVLGLIEPDHGRILMRGHDINQVRYDQLVELRKQMGIVFQDGALFDSLTVGENVGYYLLEHEHQSHQAITPQVETMLETVGLKSTINMMPDELSGGMRRRVAIARALIYQPTLMLFDEPTTGLDPVARDSILHLINRLKQKHRMASMIVTHSLTDAAEVADHFIVIQGGEIVWAGPLRQFKAHRQEIRDRYFHAVDPLQKECEDIPL